jgi:hypothetical protein
LGVEKRAVVTPTMMTSRSGVKPRCALRVGVVGNRRFADDDDKFPEPTPSAKRVSATAENAIAAVWDALFDSIGTILNETLTSSAKPYKVDLRDLFDDQPPRVAVLTALAAGGDQIGARSALEAAKRHGQVEVELEAIMPFREEYYPGPDCEPLSEFRQDEAKELRRLAQLARQVVRLDGDYNNQEAQTRAYQEARDVLLENSDLLIAIFDPTRPAQTAGTLETITRAQERHLPVIALLVREEEWRIVVNTAESDGKIEWKNDPSDNDKLLDGVTTCLRNQLVLPEALLYRESDWKKNHATRLEALDQALRRLLFIRGERLPFLCRNRGFGWLFAATWRSLFGFPSFINRGADEHDVELPPYDRFYDGASELSGAFMATYRGAFVISYFLAGLAVAAAVLLMAVSLITDHDPSMWVASGLCFAKVGILITLLVLERQSRVNKFQEAAADLRYLAEILRPMPWLTPLGVYPPVVALPAHAAPFDPRSSWMAWLARAVARCSPCFAARTKSGQGHYPHFILITAETAVAALEDANKQWIAGQADYHARTEKRMRMIEHGLAFSAKALLWTVLLGAAAACVLELFFHPRGAWIKTQEFTIVVLSTVAAILPAFIAAFSGVAFQSEAKRLANRSQAMHEYFAANQTSIVKLVAALNQTGADRSKAYSRVSDVLRKMSASTIEEAGDWKVFYQVHEIHAA